MDVETRRAIEILDEDIGLHRKYLRMNQKDIGDPGYDLNFLRYLADDILVKQEMIQNLKSESPFPQVLDEYIGRIKEEYLPAHERYVGNRLAYKGWQDDQHHKKWIKNYQFLIGVMEKKKSRK
jgi:hypothetical protein